MNTITQLTDAEKTAFTEEFLEKFLTYGFGTLPKREIEILIFHLLYHKSTLFKGQSNYDIANQLKITESRVKALKSEAGLKYEQIEHHEALEAIARLFFEYQTTRPVLEGEMIQFAMEDPVLRREFEHAVKKLGYFIDYSFNREIVRVKAAVFLEIFITNFSDIEGKFGEAVKASLKNEKEYQKIISKAVPLSQRIEMFLAKHPNKIALVTSILSIFSPI